MLIGYLGVTFQFSGLFFTLTDQICVFSGVLCDGFDSGAPVLKPTYSGITSFHFIFISSYVELVRLSD